MREAGRPGHGQGRGAAAWRRTSGRARRALAPEPWPRRAAARTEQGSASPPRPVGGQPGLPPWGGSVPAGVAGRREAQSDMTWSGETSRGRAPGPRTPAGAAGTSRSQSLAFRKEPTHSSPFGTSEPSRRQEMVLPSSRLGLGPRTSSSPSSSDSRICCTGNHYTPPQEPAPKVKPKDPHRRRQHHRKRAAPRRHRPPRRFHHLGRAPARAGDHPSRPPPAPPSLPSLPTFLSLLFLPSFSLCPWLSSPAPGTPHPPETPD